MAGFVLLARTAPAGVVAADLARIPYRPVCAIGCAGSGGSTTIFQVGPGVILSATGRLRNKLDVEHEARDLILDRVLHVLKHLEGFFLVDDQRVLLGISSETDSFPKIVHIGQV